MTRPYQVSRPAPLTPAERMERKRKVQAQRQAEKEARQEVKQTLKLAGLRYDYGQVDEQHRERVQMAAIEILAHGEKLKQNIITIGKRLLEVKEVMPGKFTAWFIEEFNLSDRMAQNMMNVAREYGERPETVSGLSDSVLYVLAAPSTPPEVRLQVETAFKETGKSPSRTEVKRAIKARKATPTPSKIDIINRDLDAYEAEAAREAAGWLDEEAQAIAEVEAEHTEEERLRAAMNFAREEGLTFEQWWAMMPKDDMTLQNWLLIFETAKLGAQHVRTLRPALGLSVANYLVPVSKLITAIEQELKRE